jgi:hypothetical protein
MNGFNPDRYIEEKKGPFDPNAYLAAKTGKQPPAPGMEDIGAGDTFLANLAPKGIVSSLYGATEAAPGSLSRPLAETMARYRKERDYAKTFLEESKKQNPRSALAGKVVGTTPYAIAAGPEVAAQGLLGGALSAAESDADLTRLDDPTERQRFGRDVGTGLITGTALGGMARYAPVTTATVGTGALAGGLATGDDKGTLYGAGAGLLLRGGMAAANPVTREAVKNFIFKPYEASPNAPAIIEAAERQGISRDAVPGYMLTENEEAKRSADALLKSGRLGGGLMRKEIEPVRNVLKEGTENLLADATPKSAYEVGTAVQKGVRSKAEGLLEPIAAEYEALDTKYGASPASSRSVKNVGKKLEALQSEPGLGPEARSILGEVSRDIENVKTIGDLKKIRTNLNNQLKRDGQGNVISDKNAIRVVSELNDAFTNARENSIKLSGKKVSYDMSNLPTTSKEVPDVGQMSPLLLRERLSRGEIINVGDFEVIPTESSKGNRVSVYKNGQLITNGTSPGMNSDDIGVAELPKLLAKHDTNGSLGSELEQSLNTPTQGREQPGARSRGISEMSDTDLWTPIALPKKSVSTSFWDGVLESKKIPAADMMTDKRGGPAKQIGNFLFRKMNDGKVVVSTADGEVLSKPLAPQEINEFVGTLQDSSIGADLTKKGFKIPKSVSYDRDAIANQRAVDAKYRGTIGEIEKALPYGSKGGKGGLLPVEKLERVQPEKVRESLGLFTDRDTREAFSKTFPEEAELVRRAELSKIKSSTTPPQGEEQRNPRMVLNELYGSPRGTPRYDDEALVALLKEKKLTADDLRIIAGALPQNYNPSGTSNQATFLDAMMSPKESIGSYLAKKKLDLKSPSARGLLKGKPDAGKVGKAEEAIKGLFDKTGKGLLRKDDRR